MNKRRWFALLVAIVLIFMSIGVRFTVSVASGLFTNLFNFDMNFYQEEQVRQGDFDKKIVVVHLDGVIMESSTTSFFMEGYNHTRIIQMLEQAFSDPLTDAVVLKVNSPGGAVAPTADIHRTIVELMEEYEKPMYVSMGETAASGGYYVAAPADKIFAEASTLTGSIGVIMENVNFAGLAERYGITFNTIKSGKHKDIMSSSREMTEEERNILQSIIDEMYDDFVQVIVDGRNLSEQKVREIGDGRIYTGRQAIEVGLVDEIGNLDDTIDALMAEQNLENATVVQYSTEISIFGQVGMLVKNLLNNETEFDQIMKLIYTSDQPRAMYIY